MNARNGLQKNRLTIMDVNKNCHSDQMPHSENEIRHLALQLEPRIHMYVCEYVHIHIWIYTNRKLYINILNILLLWVLTGCVGTISLKKYLITFHFTELNSRNILLTRGELHMYIQTNIHRHIHICNYFLVTKAKGWLDRKPVVFKRVIHLEQFCYILLLGTRKHWPSGK